MPIKYNFTRKGATMPEDLLIVERTLNKALQNLPVSYEIGKEDNFVHYPIIDVFVSCMMPYMAKLPTITLVTKLDTEVFRSVIKAHKTPEDEVMLQALEDTLTKILEIYDFRAWYQNGNW